MLHANAKTKKITTIVFEDRPKLFLQRAYSAGVSVLLPALKKQHPRTPTMDTQASGARAYVTIARNLLAMQEGAQTQFLALLQAKAFQALIITLFVVAQSAPAHAWRVHNKTDYPIRARISAGLGNTSCGDWDSASGFEIGPGGDAGPNWTDSDCNPSGLQDRQFVMQIFVCDRSFCPGDITFDPTDYVPAEGQMQTFLTMRAGGFVLVHEQDRLYMGLPSNLYALSYYLAGVEDYSDYYARDYPFLVPPMQPNNRDVQFIWIRWS